MKNISIVVFWAMERVFLQNESGLLRRNQPTEMAIILEDRFSTSVVLLEQELSQKMRVWETMLWLRHEEERYLLIRNSMENKWPTVSIAK